MAETDKYVQITINESLDEKGGKIVDILTEPIPLEKIKEIRLAKLPRIIGKLSDPKLPRIIGKLSGPKHVLTGILSKEVRTDYYTGTYAVRPSSEEQTLPTKNRMMSKDVLVEEIPYFETTNESGGYTVIIG